MHNLLPDYHLTNKTQFIVLHRSISNQNTLNAGVPKGSTLVSYYFFIYVNDFPLISNVLKTLFADDTCLTRFLRDVATAFFLYCGVIKKLIASHMWYTSQ